MQRLTMKSITIIYIYIYIYETLLTKNEEVQTFIRHILIYQYLFISFNAAAQKSNKIVVLELGYEHSFIF